MREIQVEKRFNRASWRLQPVLSDHASRRLRFDEDTVLMCGNRPLALIMVGLDAEPLRRAIRTISFKTDNRTDGLVSTSRTFGSLPRNTIRRDFCSHAGLMNDAPQADARLRAFAEVMGRKFAAALPSIAAEQLGLVGRSVKPEWVLPGGYYTSGIVNKDNPLRYHFDSLNFPGLWSGMVTLKQDIEGGALILPEYDVALDLPDQSGVYFQGQHELHGVEPFRRLHPGGHRLTAVYYAMQPLCNCGTAREELARIQRLKTGRTQKRAGSVRALASLDLKTQPVCPIFIPSKGRAAAVAVARALKGARTPFTLVVEPQDEAAYRAQWPGVPMLVLDGNDRGVTYVRQFILNHCRKRKIPWYWQIDDNIGKFLVKIGENLETVPPNYVLAQIEVERQAHPQMGLLGPDYQQFAGLARKDASDNTRVYCCVLTRTDTRINYRPETEMKEDVDFCLQHVAAGWQTRLFHKFGMAKPAMGKQKRGGLVEKYKKGLDGGAARALVRLWPEVASLVTVNGRVDAKIDWKAARRGGQHRAPVKANQRPKR